jgi:hypothetical protein
MPGEYFKAVERLDRLNKPAERLPLLKAARDALLIEAAVAVVFTACAFAVLIQQGIIVWP